MDRARGPRPLDGSEDHVPVQRVPVLSNQQCHVDDRIDTARGIERVCPSCARVNELEFVAHGEGDLPTDRHGREVRGYARPPKQRVVRQRVLDWIQSRMDIHPGAARHIAPRIPVMRERRCRIARALFKPEWAELRVEQRVALGWDQHVDVAHPYADVVPGSNRVR